MAESAEKGRGKHNEWIGRKTKEALGVGGLNMFVSSLLFSAFCINPPLYLLGAIGLMGVGSYAFGARDAKGGH
jgi:hypothetical protein